MRLQQVEGQNRSLTTSSQALPQSLNRRPAALNGGDLQSVGYQGS
jgi:hypothetical protein